MKFLPMDIPSTFFIGLFSKLKLKALGNFLSESTLISEILALFKVKKYNRPASPLTFGQSENKLSGNLVIGELNLQYKAIQLLIKQWEQPVLG